MGCVIIGASHAGVQAALNLRNQGYQEQIILISNEKVLPYQRPPLSKAFLQNTLPEQRLWLRPDTFYKQKDIELRLGDSVVSVDRIHREITLSSKEKISYDQLIFATGASVKRLGIPGSEYPEVHYLRDYEDTIGIRDALDNVNDVIVIGGGYIGLEAAASLTKLGKKVTLLVHSERPLSKVTSTYISDYLTKVHTHEGVDIHTNTSVTRITKQDGRLVIETSTGASYQADLIVVGIGVSPTQTLAEQSGLSVDNGICVNEYMQTSDDNIYAIGDCASFYHSVYQKTLRIESVQNATDQAKTVASSICGTPTPYSATAWFWSDQFDEKLQIVGLSEGYDETVIRQESERSLAVFYFRNNHLIAVDTINQPKTFMITRKHLHNLPVVDKAVLADINLEINTAFTK